MKGDEYWIIKKQKDIPLLSTSLSPNNSPLFTKNIPKNKAKIKISTCPQA